MPQIARVLLISPLALLATYGALPVFADEAEAKRNPANYTIQNLAWMTGDWRSDRQGELLQELWSAPIGDSMMCSFRWMKGEKSWMYELITITEDHGELTLRLKHFSNRLVGWEPREDCLDLVLVRGDEREAVFEHPERHNLKRLTYKRRPDDTLLAIVEGIKEDGSPSKLEIVYRLSR